MTYIVKLLIQTYRWFISPLLGHNCRFEPSCSAYFLQSIDTHGLLKGSLLGIKRIAKCHPWGSCGYDPVPPKDSQKAPN